MVLFVKLITAINYIITNYDPYTWVVIDLWRRTVKINLDIYMRSEKCLSRRMNFDRLFWTIGYGTVKPYDEDISITFHEASIL